MIYLTAAIENAVAREAGMSEPRIFSGHCSGFAETPIGRISVGFVVASGVSTNRPEHMRQCWELNGKRISKVKLIDALK